MGTISRTSVMLSYMSCMWERVRLAMVDSREVVKKPQKSQPTSPKTIGQTDFEPIGLVGDPAEKLLEYGETRMQNIL